MKCCEMDSKSVFLLGARVFFGAWLLYIGLVKVFFIGPTTFVGHISAEFASAWPPAILITVLAWTILAGEVLLGVLLLSGLKQRCVWMLTALLMFTLMFGQTILQKNDMVASIWVYVFFSLACAALSAPVASGCCSKKE